MLDHCFLLGSGRKTWASKEEATIALSSAEVILVSLHVDDTIYTSSSLTLTLDFQEEMKKSFKMTYLGELSYFLGIEVKEIEEGIFVSQDKYSTKLLKSFNMDKCNP